MKRDEAVGPQSPLYLQLRELIRSKIENGEYPPGTAIPSVGALAEKYGIHRLSVRSAISALIGEGMLKSVQGKGIFVVGEKLEQDLETVGGFEQTLKASAKHYEQRILIKACRPAGALYASRLDCSPDEALYYIKRLRLLDGEPLSLEEIYIPQWLVPNLADVDLNVFPLHDVYEFYGVCLVRGEQSLSITRLDSPDARLLDVDPRRGVLTLQCVSFGISGHAENFSEMSETERPVEFTRTHIRSDKCDLSVHFHR